MDENTGASALVAFSSKTTLTSDVWKCFSLYSDILKPNVAICNICNVEIAMGKTRSTSSMRNHVRSRHPIVFASGFEILSNAEPNTSNRNVKIQLCKVDSVIRWVVNSYLPLEIVSSLSFKDMISELCASSTIPEATVLAIRLEELNSQISDYVGWEISSCPHFSVAVESWKDISGLHYDCYSCSFVDTSWEKKTIVASTVGKHIGDAAGKVSSFLHQNFGVVFSKVDSIVHSGMDFLQVYKQDGAKVDHFSNGTVCTCFSTAIEAIIASAFPADELEASARRAWSVAMMIERSPFVAQIIHELSTHCTIAGRGILSWWSLWHIFSCLMLSKALLTAPSRAPDAVCFIFSLCIAMLFEYSTMCSLSACLLLVVIL